MGRDELIRRLWAVAQVLEQIQLRLQQRRRGGATPQLDAELQQLKQRFVAVGGTIVPEHLRDLDNVVALVMEIEAGRAVDIPSAIASIDAARRAERADDHRHHMQQIRDDAQHQSNLAMHRSILGEGRRTRRTMRAPWRKYT